MPAVKYRLLVGERVLQLHRHSGCTHNWQLIRGGSGGTLPGNIIQQHMAVCMKVSAVALQLNGNVLVGTLLLSQSDAGDKLGCTIPCAGGGVALPIIIILLYKGGELLLYGW